VFPPGPGGPPAFVEELKNKNPGPPSHAGNPKPGWDKQFNRHYMAQHYVVDYTKDYDNLLLSYGEHSQVQRFTYGLNLVSMDFLALDDHDNGWIPSGTDTAYKAQWDSLFYLHDDLDTVTKVIGINGKTSAHYNYDEFGRPLGAVKLDPNWSGPDNAIAYTGYTYDHFAELYYAQARYYLPDIGRFISQDPWAGDMNQPGTLNPYPYVLNNPLRYVDPLGLRIDQDLGGWEVKRQLEKVQTPLSDNSAVGTAWNEYESNQGHSGISNIMQQFWQWRENNFKQQYLMSVRQAHQMLLYKGITPDDPNYLQELRIHVELFESANNFIGPSGGLKIIDSVNKGYNVLRGTGKSAVKSTLDYIDDITIKNGKYYAPKDVIDEIGRIESKGVDFSQFNSKLMSSRSSTEGGLSQVIKYSDENGTRFIIHQVTDGVGNIIHRDFDAVMIESGQLINKLMR